MKLEPLTYSIIDAGIPEDESIINGGSSFLNITIVDLNKREIQLKVSKTLILFMKI